MQQLLSELTDVVGQPSVPDLDGDAPVPVRGRCSRPSGVPEQPLRKDA